MNAPARRLFRRGLVALLLLLAGTIAVGSAVVVLQRAGSVPDASRDPAMAAATDEDGAAGEAETVRRRERVRVDPAQERGAIVRAEPVPPPAEAGGGTPPVGTVGVVISVRATRSGEPLQVIGGIEPDFDVELASPPLIAPRKVEPGRPPLLATAHFVAAGPDTSTEPRELVGDREPELEEGVPVALSGRVIDLADRTPVAGAAVSVTSTFYVRRFQYDHHLREVARVRTDAEGRYEIRRLNADPAHFGPGGRVLVTVRAVGFAPAEAIPLQNVKPGFESYLPDIVLSAETHTLSGRVTDHWENLPVADARVVATGSVHPIDYPKDQREALFIGAPETVTDADGRFELTGLGPGPQWISVHHGDDCIGRERFDVPTQDGVSIRAHPARGRITGVVLDAFDEPVPLAIVAGGGNNTHSFGDGSFVLENFRGDVVNVDVTHPEFRAVRLRGVEDGTEELVVRLEHPRPRIRLDVRDELSGEPIRHIEVGIVAVDGAAVTGTDSPHYLDEHGVHEIVLPDGATALVVSAAGHAPVTIDVSALRDGDSVSVGLATAR